MREWLIKRLGGFTTTEDFIEQVRHIEKTEEKYKILTIAVKKLFNTIGADDILKANIDGTLMFEGRPLTRGETDALKKSVELFQQSLLWKILEKELKYQANRKMFVDSENVDDIVAGKLLLYYIDIVNTRLKRI